MSFVKLHVKKGDEVVVLSGKDKGQKGKVIEAMPKKGKVLVEGINLVKRHTKPNQKAPQGGILTKEAALNASKVMLVCPSCGKPTRTGHREVNGHNVRVCKKCNQVVDQTK